MEIHEESETLKYDLQGVGKSDVTLEILRFNTSLLVTVCNPFRSVKGCCQPVFQTIIGKKFVIGVKSIDVGQCRVHKNVQSICAV